MIYVVYSIISAIAWGIVPLLDRYSSRYLNGLTLASSRGLVLELCAITIFTTIYFRKK